MASMRGNNNSDTVCHDLFAATSVEEFDVLFDAAVRPKPFHVDYIPPKEQWAAALRKELQRWKLHQLQDRADAAGATTDDLTEANHAYDPKKAHIDLICKLEDPVPTMAQLVPWPMFHGESDSIDENEGSSNDSSEPARAGNMSSSIPIVSGQIATTLEKVGLPGAKQQQQGSSSVSGQGDTRRLPREAWLPKQMSADAARHAKLGKVVAGLRVKLDEKQGAEAAARQKTEAAEALEREYAELDAQAAAQEEAAAKAEAELERLRKQIKDNVPEVTVRQQVRDRVQRETKLRHRRWAELLRTIHSEQLQTERINLGAHALWKEAIEIYGFENAPPLPWVERWIQRTGRRNIKVRLLASLDFAFVALSVSFFNSLVLRQSTTCTSGWHVAMAKTSGSLLTIGMLLLGPRDRHSSLQTGH
eukprot:SAG31_NODE_298_length_18125_cov_27.373350_4_plen_418_part_00